MAYDVFLSHANADKPEVEALARRLREDGVKPFLDKWHLIPGEPWQEALEDALEASLTCAVFVGQALGPWQNEEMRDALDERTRNRDFRVIPVLLPGATKPGTRKLPRFLRRLTWVDFRNGLDDEDAYRRLVSGIRHVPPDAGPAPSPSAKLDRSMARPCDPGWQESDDSGTRKIRPGPGKQRPPTRAWWRNMVLLVLAMILLPLWCYIHLYQVVAHVLTMEVLGVLGTLTLALLYGAWKLITWLLGKDNGRSLVNRTLASPPTTVSLMLLWLVVLSYGLTHSSVRILWLSDTGLNTVKLVAARDSTVIEEVTFGKGVTEVTILVTTGWPWRAPQRYEIHGAGYLPISFYVPLLLPRTIRLDRDLEPSPTVIFRPPIPALMSLENDGRLCVWQILEDDRQILLGRMLGKRRSFQMGSERTIEAKKVESWRHDLESKIAETGLIQKTIKEWKEPVRCTPPERLRPGMRLKAEVRNRVGRLKAWVGPFLLEREPLVDKLMIEITEDHEKTTTDCLHLPDDDEPCVEARS